MTAEIRRLVYHSIILLTWGVVHGTIPASAQDHSPAIVNVQANATTVGRYEKFELTFDITNTVATHLDFPYDPDAPPPIPAGTGISVDGLFSNDNWATTLTQPGFRYQPYERQCFGGEVENDCQYWDGHEWQPGREWLYPSGEPVWKIRFAPAQLGVWQYRIRVTDAAGTSYYPPDGSLSFNVTPSSNPGFVRVGQNDPGYFEFSDGSPFIGVGHNSGYEDHRLTYAVDEEMERLAENRVNFLRIWMTGDSIYMAPWHPWTSHLMPYDGGYFPAASLTYAQAYQDHLVSLRLWDWDDPAVGDRRNPCMFQGFANNVAVQPSTTYQLRVRLRTIGVSGPRDAAYPYGFTVRTAGWLGENCADPAVTDTQSTRLLDHVNGDTAWHEITTTLTTGPDDYFLGNLYLVLENTTAGEALVDEVSLREIQAGAPVGPEILRKNSFAYHLYFDQQPSWQWDYILEQAAQHRVYIRPVVLEKNDWIANHLDQDGNTVGAYYDLDNNRFYAAPGWPVRRLHEYFWRYLTARWGYSTAVHSWELLNEGDPYNSNHYDQANDFANHTHALDPNRHLVTTSFWHSFPNAEFWSNPDYAAVDYADLHAYACCGTRYDGWPQNIAAPLALEDRPAYVVGGSGHSVHIPGAPIFYQAGTTSRALTIRGAGEWLIRYRMKASNLTGSCPYGDPETLAGPRLAWSLDNGQANVVPPAASGASYVCTAPAGTYDWRTLDSQHTLDGSDAPLTARLVITDDQVHSLLISFQNSFGSGGDAWIDEVELLSPSGEAVHLNGSFDLTRIDHDAALLTVSYSLRFGGRTLSGPGRPLTRGEVAIGDDDGYLGDQSHDQANDTAGVWLHNFLWGQLNPGGLYELYWDPVNIRHYDLYDHYRALRDFMDDIPLNNGRYRDAQATTSHPDLRAWGQVDWLLDRGHLWVQNRQHTWRNVVDGVTITPQAGSVTIPGLPTGLYRVTWWDTWNGTAILTQTIPAVAGGLDLSLPAPLADDIALQFEPVAGTVYSLYLPLILRQP